MCSCMNSKSRSGDPLQPEGYDCVCNENYIFDPETDVCAWQCEDDALGNNNTSATATPITLDYHNPDLISQNGKERDYDWFTFDLLEGQAVRVFLRFEHEFGDIDAKLYDFAAENGASGSVASGLSSSDNEDFLYLSPADQTYYLAVQPFSQEICNPYELTVEILPNPCDDSPCAGNNEVCEFLPGQDPAYQCICMEGFILDEIDGECVADPCETADCETSFSVNSHCELDWEQPEDYVCVCDELYDWNEDNQSCEWFCRNDTYEDDDTSDLATPVVLPFVEDLLVAEYGEGRDNDWFAIDIPEDKGLHVLALFQDAMGDIDMQLYDAPVTNDASGSVARSQTTSDNEEIYYAPPAPGMHYLKVYSYQSDVCNAYGLQIELVDDPCAGDPCPGDFVTCEFTPGVGLGYTCTCDGGYFPDPDNNGICVNPCDAAPCTGANSECIPSGVEAYACECLEGFYPIPNTDPVACYDPCAGHACDGSYELGCVPDPDGEYGVSDWACDCEVPFEWDPVKQSCENTCQDDRFEDNDTSDAATPISSLPFDEQNLVLQQAGDNSFEDVDWFSLDLEAGDEIYVLAEFVHSLGDIDILLYDYPATFGASGAVAKSQSMSDDESFLYLAETAGTYYLVVAPYSDQCNSYDLSIVHTPCSGNPCAAVEHGSGSCQSDMEANTYFCLCEAGYVWNGDTGLCESDSSWNCDVQDPPLDIPDDDQMDVTLEITETAAIDDLVCLVVDIEHTYLGDIALTLSSPVSGPVTVRSSSFNEGDGRLYSGYEISDFAGEAPNGIWTLNIADTYGADTGVLNSWCLILGPCPEGLPLDE